MHLLSNGLFWGFILILLGISVMIKAVFKIDIPLIKILFGFNFKSHSSGNIIFQKSRITASKLKNEYNVVFGNARVKMPTRWDKYILINLDEFIWKCKILLGVIL